MLAASPSSLRISLEGISVSLVLALKSQSILSDRNIPRGNAGASRGVISKFIKKNNNSQHLTLWLALPAMPKHCLY